MARPTVVVDGSIWKVYPTGRIPVYGKDEFGLLFELGTGPERSLSLMTEDRLTPAQLRRELRRIAWGQGRLAQKLGVWPSEVRDWLAGKEPVPEVVALDIRNLPSAR
jgi:hypothetical protein